MIDISNPAGRLHKILSEAKFHSDNSNIKEVWAKVLSVEEDDIVVTKSVVELYYLSQEIQSLIKINNSLNHELYLSSFNRMDNAFFPLNLTNNWSHVKHHLTDEALTRLQFCAEELSRFYSEETLSNEDLADIISKTEELFDSLYNSSLPESLRLALLEEVERIRNAISMYKIKGAKGLKEALQGTIGAVVANQQELKLVATTESDVMKRLGELIDKIDSFTSKALKMNKAIRSPIKYFFEKLTAPEEVTSDSPVIDES